MKFEKEYGLDKSGKLKHISNVEKGLACNLFCPNPNCSIPLIANKGKSSAHNLQHYKSKSCNQEKEWLVFHTIKAFYLNHKDDLRTPLYNLQHVKLSELEDTGSFYIVAEIEPEDRIVIELLLEYSEPLGDYTRLVDCYAEQYDVDELEVMLKDKDYFSKVFTIDIGSLQDEFIIGSVEESLALFDDEIFNLSLDSSSPNITYEDENIDSDPLLDNSLERSLVKELSKDDSDDFPYPDSYEFESIDFPELDESMSPHQQIKSLTKRIERLEYRLNNRLDFSTFFVFASNKWDSLVDALIKKLTK